MRHRGSESRTDDLASLAFRARAHPSRLHGISEAVTTRSRGLPSVAADSREGAERQTPARNPCARSEPSGQPRLVREALRKHPE